MRTTLVRLLAALALVGLLASCVVIEGEVEPPGTRSPGQGRDGQGRPGGGPGVERGRDSGKGYSFLHSLDSGEPVRWSTCEPIRYVVREQNQPDGSMRLLRESVREISEATGLEFSYEGTTGEGPRDDRPLYQPNRYGDQWAPVLVAWSTADEYPRLQGQAAGFGGAAYVSAGGATPRYVSGSAVFDVEALDRMGGEDSVKAVMLHELAHVVGLGHVDDRSQLMNPVQYGRGVTTLQDGDIAGLERVGDGECYEPIEPTRVRPGS